MPRARGHARAAECTELLLLLMSKHAARIWFRRFPDNFWRFSAQELENVWLFLPKHRLINLFEFSCQSKNSNLITGFFLSKHRGKLINLILPVKTQNWPLVWFYQWYKMNFKWICVLTREINLVNICRLLFFIFFSNHIYFLTWNP